MCCHHTHTACPFSNKALHCLKSSMSGCFSILKSIELCHHEGQINALKALWGEGKLSEEHGCTGAHYEQVCNFQSVTFSLVNALTPSCIWSLHLSLVSCELKTPGKDVRKGHNYGELTKWDAPLVSEPPDTDRTNISFAHKFKALYYSKHFGSVRFFIIWKTSFIHWKQKNMKFYYNLKNWFLF